MLSPLTRLREQAGWFAALLLTAALVAGLSAGITLALDREATAGVRAGFADRTGAALALRVGLPRSTDPVEQDAQVRAMIERRFAPVTADYAVDRTVAGEVALADAFGSLRRVTALSLDDAASRLDLVAGALPGGPDGVLVQADTAAAFELVPGDAIEVDDTALVVAGVWRARDRQDPRWLGDPLVEGGRSATSVGLLVVDESLWDVWDADPVARWTVVPDIAALDVADLDAVASAWRGLHRGWEGEEGGLRGLAKSGRLLQTVQDAESAVAAFRAVQPVALLLLGAVAVVLLAELARLLTVLRATETALLWSRGASAGRLAANAAGESLLVAIAGGALGVGIALGVLVVGSPDEPLTVGALPALLAPIGATAAVAAVAVGIATGRSALRATVRDGSTTGARGRRAAGGGILALVAAAAALSVWQLRLYGSPVTPTADGWRAVDPVAVVAPVLALVALVLAAVVALPTVARLAERAARDAPAPRLLATRSLARRASLLVAPVVAVALGTGSLVLAAGYEQTWRSAFELAGALATGSDLRATAAAPGIPASTVDALRADADVEGLAVAEQAPLQFGSDTGTIVSVAPDALAAAGTRFEGSFDPVAVADALRLAPVGPIVPVDADRLELTLEVEGLALSPAVALVVRDASGIIRTLPLEADGGSYVGGVSDGLLTRGGELRVVAVDVVVPPGAITGTEQAEVRLADLTARVGSERRELPLEGVWFAESPGPTSAPPTPTDDGLGFRAESGTQRVRLTATFDGTFADDVRPRAVISRALAEGYDLEVGDIVTFSLPGAPAQLVAEVTAIVPAVPTSPTPVALLIDLAVEQHYALRTSERAPDPTDLWIATSRPADVASELRDLLPASAVVTSASDLPRRQLLGSAAVALWAAAVGATLLAAIGVATASRSLRRDRRREAGVLRALGLAPRGQAAQRILELAATAGYGLLTGTLAGTATVVLTVAPLSRGAVPGLDPGLDLPLGLSLLPLGVALAVLVVALFAVAVAGGTDAARDARRSIPGETP